jgi:L-aspartate oxidase
VFGARAARAALEQPSPDEATVRAAMVPSSPPPPLTAESRLALWRRAGLERDASGLRELSGDPHPLVRLIALSALAREESRGAHRRRDFPATDPVLDGAHVTVDGRESARLDAWA